MVDQFEGVVRQVRLGDSESSSSSGSATTSTSTVVTYEVVITADNPDLKLKPRLTANVTIYTLERPDILTIPNKALRFVPEPPLMYPPRSQVKRSMIGPPQKAQTTVPGFT